MPDLQMDRAVTAFKNGEADCAGRTYNGTHMHDSECCIRAGLAAALPHLAGPIRAQVADEIAEAIDATGNVMSNDCICYSLAADIARELRVPDRGNNNPDTP